MSDEPRDAAMESCLPDPGRGGTVCRLCGTPLPLPEDVPPPAESEGAPSAAGLDNPRPPATEASFTLVDCPGCGATRAVHALLHGRVGEAFRYNPILFASFAVFGFAVPSLARGERPRFLERPWFGWAVVVVMVVWWVVRNLPGYR